MNARSIFRLYTWIVGCLVALGFALLLALYLNAAGSRFLKNHKTAVSDKLNPRASTETL